MKIVLLGYMASGKTIIANKLSEKMKLKHIDLDDYIEKKEGLTISEIFTKKGEIYFRKKENEYLFTLLLSSEHFVLSLGGGTPCYANNMELIKLHSTAVFLQASIQTIYNRLLKEKKQRPLVSSILDKNLKEFIAKHLFERNNYYKEAAYTIRVDGKSVTKIVNEILIKIRN